MVGRNSGGVGCVDILPVGARWIQARCGLVWVLGVSMGLLQGCVEFPEATSTDADTPSPDGAPPDPNDGTYGRSSDAVADDSSPTQVADGAVRDVEEAHDSGDAQPWDASTPDDDTGGDAQWPQPDDASVDAGSPDAAPPMTCSIPRRSVMIFAAWDVDTIRGGWDEAAALLGVSWVGWNGATGRMEPFFARVRIDDLAVDLEAVTLRDVASLGNTGKSDMVRTSNGYVVAWSVNESDGQRMELRPLDLDGRPLDPDPEPITIESPMALVPSLAWNGEHLGIAWYDEWETVDFQRYTPTAEPVGTGISLMDGNHPSLAWIGDRWGAVGSVWTAEDQTQIDFVRVLPDGVVQDRPPFRLTRTPTDKRHLRLAWADSAQILGLAWTELGGDLTQTHFLCAQADGTPLGNPIVLSAGSASVFSRPSVVWTGDHFAVAWVEGNDDGEVLMSLVSPTCDAVRGPFSLVDANLEAHSQDLIWTGERFVLAWGTHGGEARGVHVAPVECR